MISCVWAEPISKAQHREIFILKLTKQNFLRCWLILLTKCNIIRSKTLSSTQSSTVKGAYYETKAHHFLKKQGLKLLDKNFRCASGEIDLIMLDHEYLVFVEVRYRYHSQYLSSLESVDYYKQQRIRKTAEHYLHQIKDPERLCRFDIVGFDQEKIRWVKEAF